MADFTDAQKALVQKSWNLVKVDFKNNAIAFFLYFFRTHPEHQQKFNSFRGKSESEIRENVKLKSHATRVFHALSSMVDNLDDLPIVIDLVVKTVGDHYPRGIRSGEYADLFNTVVAFLAEALKEHFDVNTKAAWVSMAGVLMSVINAELSKLESGTEL